WRLRLVDRHLSRPARPEGFLVQRQHGAAEHLAEEAIDVLADALPLRLAVSGSDLGRRAGQVEHGDVGMALLHARLRSGRYPLSFDDPTASLAWVQSRRVSGGV